MPFCFSNCCSKLTGQVRDWTDGLSASAERTGRPDGRAVHDEVDVVDGCAMRRDEEGGTGWDDGAGYGRCEGWDDMYDSQV